MSIIQKVKAQSITSKAKAACKINMGLVQGAADVQNSKAFVNYGELIKKKIDSGGGDTSSAAANSTSDGQASKAIDIT